MIIPITFPSKLASTAKLPPQLAKLGDNEHMLIELQGALDVECNDSSERDGQLVGKLRLDEVSGKSTLRIGHHLIEGKVANLPKPLAIIHRTSGGDGVQWDMVAIVKRKIIFSKRPMPIVRK